MKIFIDLLDKLQDFCTEGTNLRQFETIVQLIDARGKLILQALNFDPNTLSHVELFEKQEDERLKDVQMMEESAAATPEAALPYVVTAYCKSIGRVIRRDMLAFATDFSAGANLRFRISFSSFGYNSSYFDGKTEADRIKDRLSKMRGEGYVMAQKRSGFALTDCDANRRLLRDYCRNTFGSEPFGITTHKNFIREMNMSIQYADYIPAPEPKVEDTPSELLTADDAIRLSKTISEAKSALSTYSMLEEHGDGNLVLACLRGHIYEIESITNVHGDIWKEREKEVSDVRRKNQQIRAAEERIEGAATAELAPQIRGLILKAQENMDALARKMGFHLDHFSILEYNRLDLVLAHSCVLFKTPEIELDGLQMDRGSEFYVYNTRENLNKILSTIQSALPSATLESCEVKPYMDFLYFRNIHVLTSDPADMMRILQME